MLGEIQSKFEKVDFSKFGTRPVFNEVVRHMISCNSLVEQVSKGNNLADLLNSLLEVDKISQDQILSAISLILVQKNEYTYQAKNLTSDFNDFSYLVETSNKWSGVDIVVVYFHPNSGICVANPKKLQNWTENIYNLSKKELLTVYCQNTKKDKAFNELVIEAFFAILNNDKTKVEALSTKLSSFVHSAQPAKPAPQASQPAKPVPQASQTQSGASHKGKKRLTPQYSVQVTNELFHNGNVEAWKSIIASYHFRYPNSQVIVYHEGELIHDLNSLFKWGKVKYGGVLLFQVSGDDIKGVSRLQKYLFEGASSRYEGFLKKDIHRHLKLF